MPRKALTQHLEARALITAKGLESAVRHFSISSICTCAFHNRFLTNPTNQSCSLCAEDQGGTRLLVPAGVTYLQALLVNETNLSFTTSVKTITRLSFQSQHLTVCASPALEVLPSFLPEAHRSKQKYLKLRSMLLNNCFWITVSEYTYHDDSSVFLCDIAACTTHHGQHHKAKAGFWYC